MTSPKILGLLATSLSTTAAFYGCLEILPQLAKSVVAAEKTSSSSPVDIDFDAATDRPTVVPTDRSQTDDPVGDSRTLIGLDERVPMLNRQFPWSAIGRLEWHYNDQIVSTCTATLVDTDLILTNSHCLMLPQQDSATGQSIDVFVDANQYNNFQQSGEGLLKLVFKPGMIDGVALDEATVVTYESGWSDNFSDPTEDWAVLQLDEALGDQYGYLGWRALDLSNISIIDALAENTLLAGYSGDFPTAELRDFGAPSDTAGVDLQCSVLGIWPEGELADAIVHDCDTNPGASGAPILAPFADGNYYIIGLHARQVPLSQRVILPNGVETMAVNGGVQVSNWSRAVFEML